MTDNGATLTTDRRPTPYGRWGDAFPTLCALATIAAVAGALVRRQWFPK
jgi:apolipoprotein N-acyltransferase